MFRHPIFLKNLKATKYRKTRPHWIYLFHRKIKLKKKILQRKSLNTLNVSEFGISIFVNKNASFGKNDGSKN